ncbi:zinc-binding dehydrogenase [Escherichia coli]|nr:zinc-binding dehydrogenase [Escherichia coli]
MTVWYTALVVAGSTVLGLAVAMFFNREFRLRKTARSLVILSYVTPSISLVFAWKYMFNNGYGIVNYLGVDLLHLYEQAPLWFDNPGSSFVLVVLFAIWRYFPYAFISFLAILQTIDKSLYEAAEMDGANAWQRFRIVTLPAIMPVLATVVTLRTIWMFYMFADVYLLTTKVDILGVYLYKTAFAFNDLGKAAAISVVLFIINAVNNYKLRKMPEGSSWKNAVCYDPAQFAMSGVRDANVRVGDFVVVVGLGAIGQIAIQLAKRAGASVVIGVDPIAHRCDIARRHGADFCLNPIGTDVGKEIKTLTGKQGADVIIETSGYADALQSAFRGLAYGGTISYVAFAKPFAEGFNLGREAHFNNAKIVFSRACSEPNPDYPRWGRKRIEETCWELLMNGYLNCEDLIDPVVTFANSPESYMQYVDQHPEQSIKMGVTF